MHPIPALVISVTALFIFLVIIIGSLDAPVWVRVGVIGVPLLLFVVGLISTTSPSRSER